MFNVSLNIFNRSRLSNLVNRTAKPVSEIIEQELKNRSPLNSDQSQAAARALRQNISRPSNPFTTQSAKEIRANLSQIKFDFPVTRITDKNTVSNIAERLVSISGIKIGSLGKSRAGKPIKDSSTTTPPAPTPSVPRYDIFTVDSSIGYSYDLDRDGTAETTHHDGVTTGLKMSVPNANVIPKLVNLSNSSEVLAGLQEGVRLAKGIDLKAGESKADGAYFPLGIIISASDVGQMVGMSNLNYTKNTSDPAYSTSLNNPEVNKTVRDKLMASTSISEGLKQQILAFEEMAKYIPVYISAGNDPNKFNLWALAQGGNINIIGSESSYGSAVYDKKVVTDHWWTVKNADANNDGIIDKGWDLDGNGTLDRVLKAGEEGFDLANGTRSYIYGGTSLGVGIAIGKDINGGLIIDRELVSS